MRLNFALTRQDLEEILNQPIKSEDWLNFVRQNGNRLNDEMRLIAARKFTNENEKN